MRSSGWKPYLVLMVAAVGALAFARLAWVLAQRSSLAHPLDGNEIAVIPVVLPPAEHVGRAVCITCHEVEDERWRGSHHDLAMDVANADTVLADFDGTSFEHFGVESTFAERDGAFVVRTDGPDGAMTEYEVSHVFGVEPLQQYLIEFPGGRYQALGVSWDTRSTDEGGQGWFHLYPDEPIPHDDELHWTKPSQNWNYMCAECHSTNLQRHFDREQNAYATTWSEIDVSCEACHAPGSNHVVWAEAREDGRENDYPSMGLVVRLKDPHRESWVFEPGAVTAVREYPAADRAEIEACARCHSRRISLREDYLHGRPFLDSYRPVLLEERLYHADGQILDEVYVYGSFIQSRMYQKGVTCSDCHDPHALSPRAAGNDLCAKCHLPREFDTQAHHYHEPGTAGAACVDCHMPARNYMVVDPRRDHSLRNPRPDLTVELGTPNACNGCHVDQTADWAADAVAGWENVKRNQEPHFAEALHLGRIGGAGARDALETLIADVEQPGIARATALTLLPAYAGPESLDVIALATSDTDPLVRATAAGVLHGAPPADRVRLAMPRLDDDVRAVRVQAAAVLAAVRDDQLTPEQAAAIEVGVAEFIEAQYANADRPHAHTNVASILAERGRLDEAVSSYRAALLLDDRWEPAYVNLADLYRATEREGDCERTLREALERLPEAGSVHHALGLSYVRQGRLDEAITSLGQAAALTPEAPRYAYVHAIALDSAGRRPEALGVLEAVVREHPNDRDVLVALASYYTEGGDPRSALPYAEKLVELAPDDPGARALRDRIRSLIAP